MESIEDLRDLITLERLKIKKRLELISSSSIFIAHFLLLFGVLGMLQSFPNIFLLPIASFFKPCLLEELRLRHILSLLTINLT